MMERYMLDTNSIVEMLRGNRKVVGQIEKHGIQNCFISEITIADFTMVPLSLEIQNILMTLKLLNHYFR